jgi:FlaA1/EpsC-like NDP-sugar epimerase
MNEQYSALVEYIKRKIGWLYQNYSIPTWMVFAIDDIAVFICFIMAYLLRFNFVVADIPFFLSLYQALLTVIVYSSFSLIFHSCSGLLRHTTIIDVIKVFMATTFSFVVLFILSFFSRWFALSNILNLPLSVIVIHYVLISVTLFSFRISIKISFYLITASFTKKKKVLIMGAGDMGVIVKRVILSDMANGDHKVRI